MRPSELVRDEFQRRLGPIGFERVKGSRRSYEHEVAPGVTGGITLDFVSAGLPHGTAIAQIGAYVVSWTMSTIVAELLGENPRREPRARFGHNLGYISPEGRWRDWEVDTSETGALQREVSRMVRAIEDYGTPWMQQFVSFDRMAEEILAQPGFHNGASYSRPFAYLLRGDRQAALNEVPHVAERIRSSQGLPRPGELERYLERVTEYIERFPL